MVNSNGDVVLSPSYLAKGAENSGCYVSRALGVDQLASLKVLQCHEDSCQRVGEDASHEEPCLRSLSHLAALAIVRPYS